MSDRTENLSGCPYGELTYISGTSSGSPTVIHAITADGAIDAVFLCLWNTTLSSVTVYVAMNPTNSGAAIWQPITIPAKDRDYVLQGSRFRKHSSGSNSWAVAAYVDSGNADKIAFTGHYNRFDQEEDTP